MNKPNISVLVIEDSTDDALLIKAMLDRVREPGFTIIHAECLAEGRRYLQERTFDIVLLDLGLPDSLGLGAITEIRKICSAVPLVILTGLDDEDVAVKALQMDVQDYLIKGQLGSNLLVRSIRYARERKRVIEALRASELRFRRLSESGVIGIAHFTIKGRISDANDAFLTMTGYGREELAKGKVRWDRLLPPEWLPSMQKVAETFMTTGCITPYETEYLHRDGSRRWGLFGAAGIESTEEGIAFVVDITRRKKLEEEIRHLANHDSLTGLPNRRLFRENLRFALETARRNHEKIGLLFLDLDRFKEVNDTLGHEAGDELLKTIAARLRFSIRRADTVARIGGDEFSVLLTGMSHPEAMTEIVRKILAAFCDPCVVSGRGFPITASIGISIYPDDSEDIDELFRRADIALYRAKEMGRNHYEFFNQEILPHRPS